MFSIFFIKFGNYNAIKFWYAKKEGKWDCIVKINYKHRLEKGLKNFRAHIFFNLVNKFRIERGTKTKKYVA